MIFYKNVDLQDLESIMNKGILPLNVCHNNNWLNDRRAENPTNCVYLFRPLSKGACFPKSYGIALLKISLKTATPSEFLSNDTHIKDYREFTVDKVKPSEIKAILIPNILKNRIKLSENVLKLVNWCEMQADCYNQEKKAYIKASAEILKQFAETTPLGSYMFNFFRGQNPDRTLIDLKNIKYFRKK